MSETLVLKSELETTSDIDLLDVCLSSGDFADLAQVIQANGYRGTRKFRTFSDNVTAFNSTIAKGESVDVVVLNDDFIFDKNFDYGAISQGTTYNKDNTDIIVTTETARAIADYCKYNPTTQTANTLIADANAKGFKVRIEVDGESYELLPSLGLTNRYIDSGIQPNQDTTILLDAVSNKDNYVFGADNTAVKFSCVTQTTFSSFAYNTTSFSRIPAIVGKRCLYSLQKNLAYINNDLVNEFTYSSFSVPLNMFIGCYNYCGQARYISNLMLYSAILNGDYLIPALQLSKNNQGLLNLSNNEFLRVY